MRNRPYGFEIYLVNIKTIWTIAQIFVAFSEKLNFKQFRFAPSFNNQTVLISEMKMNIVDAQNACLSGGVAVGAIADLSLQPYGAVVIGSAVGILSTIGYQLVQVRF